LLVIFPFCYLVCDQTKLHVCIGPRQYTGTRNPALPALKRKAWVHRWPPSAFPWASRSARAIHHSVVARTPSNRGQDRRSSDGQKSSPAADLRPIKPPRPDPGLAAGARNQLSACVIWHQFPEIRIAAPTPPATQTKQRLYQAPNKTYEIGDAYRQCDRYTA